MNKKERAFRAIVLAHYREYRRNLPWRKTWDPYHILVSEMMLQQTQVNRVIPKYREFLKKFKTVRALARAPLSSVLKTWSGLGYNRRAKMLHQCAKVVENEYGGRFPTSRSDLEGLPGVGPYTAGAVMAFAYNEAVPIVETNIRTVYLYHFFRNKEGVSDKEILDAVERTLDRKNPREWYYALMDHGAHLKRTKGNANIRSKHYTKQSKFKGSDREIRGAILKTLVTGPKTEGALRRLPFEARRITSALDALAAEGLITHKRTNWHLAD